MKTAAKFASAALLALLAAGTAVHAQQTPATAPGSEAPAPKPLTPAQIKAIIEGRLAWANPDMKVGQISEKSKDTYEVEILGADGQVTERPIVDKATALPAGILDHHRGPKGGPMAGPMGGPMGGFDCRPGDAHGRGDDQGRGHMGRDHDRMGPGLMDGRHTGIQRDKPLTTAQVKAILEGQIAWRGEDAKVGKVTEKDGDIITADVVKSNGELIRKIEVNRKTGAVRPTRDK